MTNVRRSEQQARKRADNECNPCHGRAFLNAHGEGQQASERSKNDDSQIERNAADRLDVESAVNQSQKAQQSIHTRYEPGQVRQFISHNSKACARKMKLLGWLRWR